MTPEPPWPVGAATNCKRVGWREYFEGKPKKPPYPQSRYDLQRGYKEGYEAARDHDAKGKL